MTVTVRDVAEHLIENYYKVYKEVRVMPDTMILAKALLDNRDNVIVLEKDGRINAVAVYLTLPDWIYSMIDIIDMRDIDILHSLLSQKGPNIHCILIQAGSIKDMLEIRRIVKEQHNPSTFSWWDPDMKRLHKYRIRSEAVWDRKNGG